MTVPTLSTLSDIELVTGFQDLIIDEQEKLALQLRFLAELDRRKIFFHYSSLRAYLVQEHGMEEHQAERRIRAARLLKRFPFLQGLLESGRLNLTLLEIVQGCSHREKLSDPQTSELLEAVAGMSCQAARRELADRYPRHEMELPKGRIRPLTGELSEVRFVATEACLEKLEEIRGLLAHSRPEHTGLSLGELIEYLATDFHAKNHPEQKAWRAKERAEKKEKVKEEEKEEEKAAIFPDKTTEILHSPTAKLLDSVTPNLKRRLFSKAQAHELILREGYRCSYVDRVTGQRCQSKYALQIDHKIPWAHGGKTEIGNARFLCRCHHARISFLQFGESSNYTRTQEGHELPRPS